MTYIPFEYYVTRENDIFGPYTNKLDTLTQVKLLEDDCEIVEYIYTSDIPRRLHSQTKKGRHYIHFNGRRIAGPFENEGAAKMASLYLSHDEESEIIVEELQ